MHRKYILQQHADIACPVCRSSYKKASFEFDSEIWSADTLLERIVEQHEADYIQPDSSDDELQVDRSLRSSSECAQAPFQGWSTHRPQMRHPLRQMSQSA
eukprot:1120699-Prymnesium_polylepis.2